MDEETVIKALKCIAGPDECCYSEYGCQYFDKDTELCDNIQLARDVLALLGVER